MSKACWKRVESSLYRFKLSLNVDSTFPLFSKMLNSVEARWTLCSTIVEHTHAHTRPQKSVYGFVYLDERDWFLVRLSFSQSKFAKVLILLLGQCLNSLNGLHTTVFLRSTFVQHPFNFCWTNVDQMLKPLKRAFRIINRVEVLKHLQRHYCASKWALSNNVFTCVIFIIVLHSRLIPVLHRLGYCEGKMRGENTSPPYMGIFQW